MAFEAEALTSDSASERTDWKVETVEDEVPRATDRPEAFVAVTVDGRRAISTAGDAIVIWDLESGVELSETRGVALAVATAARMAVVAGFGRSACFWDLEMGTKQLELEAPDELTDVAVTSNGKRAATASWDGTIKIWEVSARSCLATFVADGRMGRCDIDASGRTLVVSEACGRIHFLLLVLPDDPIDVV